MEPTPYSPTAAADAPAAGPAGVQLRCKNVWLSTIPAPGLSAPEGKAADTQTASKITIWLSFQSGVVTGFSSQSILPPRAGKCQIPGRNTSDRGLGRLRVDCALAVSPPS